MEWVTAVVAAVASILTIVVGYFSKRLDSRVKTGEEDVKRLTAQLAETKAKLAESESRIKELESRLKTTEADQRAERLIWDKERLELLKELMGLRSQIARLEIGVTAATLSIDAQGDIIDCNPIMTEMTGWTLEELKDRGIRELVPFRFREYHDKGLASVLSGEKPLRDYPLDTFLRTRTGQEIAVRLMLTAWHDDNGNKVYGAEMRRRAV